MTPVQRALDQMTRGMASPEGRAQVNAETMAARAAAADELQARMAQSETIKIQQMADMDFVSAMQRGIYGRLD